MGHITIGIQMDLKNLKYTAKYLAKLLDYKIGIQQPPFSTQSNRPGIGARAYGEFIEIDHPDPKINRTQLKLIKFDTTKIYGTDGIYVNGKKYQVPRYFDKLAEQVDFNLEPIKKQRDEKVKQYNNIFPTPQERNNYKNYLLDNGYSSRHLFLGSHKKWLLKIEQGYTQDEIQNHFTRLDY
jgi:hypothetical protein